MNNFTVVNLRKIPILLVVLFIVIGILIQNSVRNALFEVSSIKRLLPVYSVETNKNQVAITFDCAWGSEDIPSIIETLNKNQVKATFFTVGDWVNKNSESVELIYKSGMEIGNHTLNHAHVAELSYEENLDDMKKCNALIQDITGEKVRYYRGAYGEYSNEVIVAAEELGMQVIQWDIDTLDYTGKTASEMCERIKRKIRNGSIILMHNDTKYTASGLQQIIDTIKEEGYEIVALKELVVADDYEINHEGRQILKK